MRIYQWLAHDERKKGKWELTEDEAIFLEYLIRRGFLRDDLEVYEVKSKFLDRFVEKLS